MPELPEVERVRAGVANEATGKVITSITTSHPRATNARSLTALSSLRSAVIHKVNRRGKFIFFELDRPEYLVAHLGMSGRFHFRSPTTPVELHQRATLTLTGLAEQTQLRFIDPRTFGWLAVCLGTDGLPQLLANVAKDPFDLSNVG